MKHIESIFSNIGKMVSIHYKKMVRDYNQKKRQEMLQHQAQAVSYGQIYVQEALGKVLSSTSILPNLTAVTHPTDLIPENCILGDVPVYTFRWLKTSSEKISTTILAIACDKVNSAIAIECRKLSAVYSNLPDYDKPFFVQQYPAFYSGFRVVGLKDMGTDVLISVVTN